MNLAYKYSMDAIVVGVKVYSRFYVQKLKVSSVVCILDTKCRFTMLF